MTLPATRLQDYVVHWAAARPTSEAAVEGERRLSYRALQRETERWIGALERHGIVAGDRVAMLAAPGIDSLLCLLATIAVGALWCGLDPRLQPNELKQRLEDLQPKLLVLTARIGDRLYAKELASVRDTYKECEHIVVIGCTEEIPSGLSSEVMPLVVFLDEPSAVNVPSARLAAAAPCLIVYTSGSSGVPKGALLTESSIIAFCERQNALWPVRPLRTLNFLPISHAGSVIDLTLPTLVGGGCVVFQAKFDAVESLALVERERISFWASVPSTFLLQTALSEFSTTDLSSVQLIAIEGAAIPEALANALMSIAPMATNYGMTETTSAITAMPPTHSVSELLASVGRPFDDMEVRIAETDQPGEVGEIEVRSPRCFAGYWRSQDSTRACLTADGYFRTGDLGALLPDGRLRLAGRKREMFKSGGYNVFPAEVERALESHPDVDAAAVVPIAHPVWGEVGVAFIVPKGIAIVAALERELKSRCEQLLANYKRPKRIVILDSMPLLSLGKIDRQALRRLAAETS